MEESEILRIAKVRIYYAVQNIVSRPITVKKSLATTQREITTTKMHWSTTKPIC